MHRICAALIWMVAGCGSDVDPDDYPVVPGGTSTIGGRVPGAVDAATGVPGDAGVGDGGVGDSGVDDGGLGPDAGGSLDAPTSLPDSAGGALDAPLGLPDSAGGSLDAAL